MFLRTIKLADSVYRSREDDDGGSSGGAEPAGREVGQPTSRHAEFEAAVSRVMGANTDASTDVGDPAPARAPAPDPDDVDDEPDLDEQPDADTGDDDAGDDLSADHQDGPGEDTVRLAKHYGLRDDEIDGQTESQLRTTLAAIGRRLYPETSGLQQQGQPQFQPGQEQQFPPGQYPYQPQQYPGQPDPFEAAIEKLKEDGYDESLLNVLRHSRQEQQQQYATMQSLINQQLQHQQYQAQESLMRQRLEMEKSIDSLGNSQRFGGTNPDANTPEQTRNFFAVLERMEQIRSTPGFVGISNEELARQAEFDLFGRQEMQQASQARSRAIQKQGRRVTGKPGTPAKATKETPWDGDPTRDPVLHRMFQDMIRENGGTA